MHPGRALRADLMTQQSRILASITDRVKHILSTPRLHANMKSFHFTGQVLNRRLGDEVKLCKTYGSLHAFGVWIDLVLRNQQSQIYCHVDTLPPNYQNCLRLEIHYVTKSVYLEARLYWDVQQEQQLCTSTVYPKMVRIKRVAIMTKFKWTLTAQSHRLRMIKCINV
jgi:hypothetical protein